MFSYFYFYFMVLSIITAMAVMIDKRIDTRRTLGGMGGVEYHWPFSASACYYECGLFLSVPACRKVMVIPRKTPRQAGVFSLDNGGGLGYALGGRLTIRSALRAAQGMGSMSPLRVTTSLKSMAVMRANGLAETQPPRTSQEWTEIHDSYASQRSSETHE